MYRDSAGRFTTIETPPVKIPEGWTVVKEHRGIITIRPLKDCRDHVLACMSISREDDEAELRKYAVSEDHSPLVPEGMVDDQWKARSIKGAD